MWCNQIFSIMSYNETTSIYTIENTIVADNYEIANRIARSSYGANAIALDTTLIPVKIGYTYCEGVYYDENGNIVEANQTESEQISKLNAQISDIVENEADLLYELSLLQLGITD